ncbi:MAG TPA: hypothetical protein VGL74_06835 [Terriglobales bacterium]|jgi:hypothetical protein
MRKLLWSLLLVAVSSVHVLAQQLSAVDAVRIREFYRLAEQIQDRVWPHWSQTPAPLLLVTEQGEFLTHHPAPPKDFKKISGEFYARQRTFPTNLLATFPAFGPPSVIVIGEPANTVSKTSTPWLITLMHEHFHQLQNSQPRYFQAVEDLNLSGGDTTGMWMLNYPFPYGAPGVVAGFAGMRDLLLQALSESDQQKFAKLAAEYSNSRKLFFAQLSPSDHKYLAFQLWQEGIARYTQVKVAEEAVDHKTTVQYAALPDFESFGDYAEKARRETLDELRTAEISKQKREIVYAWGAAEGFLLDRLDPGWKDKYFSHPFSLDYFFEQ